MSDQSQNSDIQLLKILNIVFGTKEIVRCRRFYSEVEVANYNSDSVHIHVIGSRGDGFDLPGSDVDCMFVSKTCFVSDACNSGIQSARKYPLQIVYCPQSSGYVCLKFITAFYNEDIHYFAEELSYCNVVYQNRSLISSHLFLNYHSNWMKGSVNGPSIVNMLPTCMGSDMVTAFESKCWPIIANEWLLRTRTFSWPSQKIIDKIRDLGCHLVPIGEHNSPIADLQWRISFVISEKFLIQTFNNVQFKVYGLLKLIKSSVFNNYKCVEYSQSLINSYHVKTVMMWVIENTPEQLWTNERLVLCLRLCFRYIKHFVTIGYLPNYFLPTLNLFRKHSNSDIDGLISKIDILITNPVVIFSSLSLLQDSIYQYFADEDAALEGSRVFQRECIYATKFIFSTFYSCVSNPQQAYNQCTRCVNYYVNTRITSQEYSFMLCWRTFMQSVLNKPNLILTQENVLGNKIIYIEKRKLKQICLTLTQFNITGWLNLATYFYLLERHNDAQDLCRKVTEMITSETYYCGKDEADLPLSVQGLQLDRFLKYKTASFICFMMMTSFQTKELAIEVNNSLSHCVQIPPLAYAYFVSFLCAYHANDRNKQWESLTHLEYLLHDKHYGFDRRPFTVIIFNLVGICYEILGDKSKAEYHYRLSLNMNIIPNIQGNYYSNATEIRLRKLRTNYI